MSHHCGRENGTIPLRMVPRKRPAPPREHLSIWKLGDVSGRHRRRILDVLGGLLTILFDTSDETSGGANSFLGGEPTVLTSMHRRRLVENRMSSWPLGPPIAQ